MHISFDKIWAIIIGIEGVAMIRHYLFTRARNLT